MTKLDDEVGRGRDAEYLLDHPIYIEAMGVVRDELMKAWELSPARDTEGREHLWMMLRLLDKLSGHIKTVATTGKLAARQIADKEKARAFGAI